MEERSVIAKKIFLILAILSIIDIVLGVLFYLFFNMGFFYEKSIGRIASDLAFLEGAAVFCAGAIVVFFSSRFSLREIIWMVIGAAMIGISVAFGLFA